VNLKIKDLKEVVARAHFNMRMAILEDDDDVKDIDELKDSAEVFGAILNFEPHVATFLGVSITSRMMTTIWSEFLSVFLSLANFWQI